MEIGNEIGQKIRSAIKAKLVDLGAYVDDELPDYVMVMVANKKTQVQMSEDLHLFLGSNTAKFTSWLHGLLEKLLSITTDSADQQASKKLLINEDQLHPDAEKISKDSTAKSENRTVVDEPITDGKPVKSKSVGESLMQKSDLDSSSQNVGSKQPEAAEDEPLIRLRLEHDEFEEECAGGDVASNLTEAKATGTKAKSARAALRKLSKELSQNKAGEVEEYVPMPPRRPSYLASAEARGNTRKRVHSLGSSVGAVLKHDVEDNDDGYDPYKPAIGNVASVIKVTERKSSVPPSLQASKSLLLLAIKQAEQSVALKRKMSDPSEDKILLQSKKNRADIHRRLDHDRGGVHSRLDRTNVRSRLGKTSRSPVQTSDSFMSQRKITVRPKIQAVEQTSKPRKTVKVSIPEKEEDMFASSEEGSEKLEDTSDTRLVRCLDSDVEPDNVAEQEASVLEAEDVEEVEEVEEIEQQADKTPAENIEEEVEEEEEDAEVAHLRKILIKQQRKPAVTEPTTNPKFIVTLDGGYPMKEGDVDEFQMDEDDNNDLDLTVPEKIPRNVVRVQPQQLQQAISSDLADEAEDEGVFEGAPSKKSRAVDKCRFWPSCRNTGSCPFYHPTVPCKTFPNCRFGDKCLYIHPACKFGPACQNPACSYAHSGPRPSLMQPQMPVFVQPIRVPIFQMPPQQMYAAPMRHRPPRPSTNPQQMKCKFFPNCTDMNCRFAHPKPCRYGLSCTIKSTCPYSHPELPAKGQLKWVSSATSN